MRLNGGKVNTFPKPSLALSAALLAGGSSTRMGVDKALLSLRPNSPPMAQMVIDRLTQIADEVQVIASDRPEYEIFGVKVVPDDYPGFAALGGIATALAHCRSEHCLVVACDMPFLNESLLYWMAAQPRDYDVLVPRLAGESRQGGSHVYQTLHAIYGKRCLPFIKTQLRQGNRQVIGFFDHVDVRTVSEKQIRAFDPDLRSFFNANSPDALPQAREWLDEMFP
jgi:molybdopterin-guanine dinucleotide biosynthesis protein A